MRNLSRQHPGGPLLGLSGCDFSAIMALSVMTFWIHRSALQLWWLYDDPFILRVALSNSLFASFSDPAAYQQLSLVSFTPLLQASFKLDYLLFGFHPLGYYLHQLLLLATAVSLLYLLMRRWNRAAALWASTLFLVGGPAAAASHLLMIRHYLEGGVFALITIVLLGHDRASRWTVWAAGITYLLACLSKEVYVPLVVAAPLLIAGSVRDRLRTCGPLFLGIGVYTLWRIHMLRGAGLGGYTPNWFNQWADPGFVLSGLREITTGLWSSPDSGPSAGFLMAGAILTLLLVLISLVKSKQPNRVVGVLLLTTAALTVIVPVWGGCQAKLLITHRLFFHISLITCVGAGFLASRALDWNLHLSQSPAGLGSVILLLTLASLPVLFFAVQQNRLVQATMTDDWVPHSRENQFYFLQPAKVTLVTATDGHHWEDLQWMRQRAGGGPTPAVCMLPFDLRNKPARYSCYERSTDQFIDCTGEFEIARQAWLGHLASSDELEVRIEIDRGRYAIDLGSPDPSATYFLLFGAEPNVYWSAMQIRHQFAGQLFTKPTSFHVRAARRGTDQQWALSPEWVLNLAERQTIRWP